MKTLFCGGLFAFSLTMVAALPAQASPVVQTRVDAGTTAQKTIHPYFHVKTNSGTQTLAAGSSVRE